MPRKCLRLRGKTLSARIHVMPEALSHGRLVFRLLTEDVSICFLESFESGLPTRFKADSVSCLATGGCGWLNAYHAS